MGGSLHATRQDTASSSHQATSNQLPTSTCSDPLLPTHSPDDCNLRHYQVKDLQPDISPADINHPSSPSNLACSGSSEELLNDDDDEVSLMQQELAQSQTEPVRTAETEVKPTAEDPECNTDRSSEPQSEQPCVSRLSLFSGMELVTKGRLSVSEREAAQTETDMEDDTLRENPAVRNGDSPVDSSLPRISRTSEDASSICSSVISGSSQPVSAFSFLNF